MITFLHVPKASQKTLGDARLFILGKSMDGNLRGSRIDLIIAEDGDPVLGYF